MRLLCDEMLVRLGRWLRAAGYDTVIAEGGMPDAILLARCAAEERILLTRDRHLAAVADGRVSVVCLDESSIAAQARALRAAQDIDWQHAPFIAVWSTTRRSPPRRPTWYRRCRPFRGRLAGPCGDVRNAAGSTGPAAMSAE